MHFVQRPPSSTWEPVAFPDEPPTFFWAWFKPPAAPHGLAVRIPVETFRNPARRLPLTMRRVLTAAGVDPGGVALWSLYGAVYDAYQGASPALDFAIPEPGMAGDPSIHIFLSALPPAAIAVPVPAPAAALRGGSDFEALVRMDADWNSSLQLEQQLAGAAKQLSATLQRINTLNRDLSFEEGRVADQLDKHEWQEARRWLRDVAARVARFLKDHHIGLTSAAGKRGSFEAIYQQYVVPRVPFDGLVQAEREFEQYRKTMQTLLNNMGAAQASANQDGERRAQIVLTRIGAKVRTLRPRK
jgi:hypothetical protein